jgi:alkyl hydroperoxide reductase subunit F
MYDLIIIGGGPAGITAGVYAARKRLKTLILTQDIGGQMAWSSDVENYPGFSMISGADLVEKFENHIEQFRDVLELRLTNKGVTEVDKNKTYFSVKTGEGSSEHSRSVIVAGGRIPKSLGIKGEKEYLNKGVSYCAWCDGPIFKNKDIAIIGGGNSALDTAINIERSVKSIVIINPTNELTGDKIMIDKVTNAQNIRVLNNTEIISINGDKFVSSISVKPVDKDKPEDLKLSGVFIEIGSIPATDYLKNLVKLNDKGEIVVDKYNMSSVEGLYAAGDITDIEEKQIVTAAGEGAKAAIMASKYIARFEDE